MDINFSDADNQFRQEVKDYLENKYPKHVKEKQNNGEQLTKQDMIDYHKSLYEQGWAGYNWPVEYGGTGWSATQLYLSRQLREYQRKYWEQKHRPLHPSETNLLGFD